MNRRSLATDDRLVDTLAAMHESVKGLVQQKARQSQDGGRAATPPIRETIPEPAPASVIQPGAASKPAQARSRRGGERLHSRCSIRLSLGDLVAAARRAAQAAAARAAHRDAAPATGGRRRDETHRAEPGQHKMSLLMVVAALLLVISAALLFTRLKSKPDLDAPPPARPSPAPATRRRSHLPYQPDADAPTLMAARHQRYPKRRRSRLTPSPLAQAAWAIRHRFASARIPSMPRSFRHRSAPAATGCSLPASA